MVRHAQDGEPNARPLERHLRTRGFDVRSGADVRDPRSVQMAEGVEQRLLAVVQRVVVGQSDDIDSQGGEGLRRGRRRTEEEGLERIRPRFSAIGDAALEVQDETSACAA